MTANDVDRSVGRPRTALFLAGARGADVAKARGCARVADSPRDGERYDVVVVGGLFDDGAEPRALAERAAAMVEDGGHVLLDLARRAPHARPLVEVAKRAGLEPLHVEREGGDAMVVARRAPEKRKLSLTVGMISMNEEGAVGRVIDDIRAHAPGAEVLLVDSSKDRTPEIAQERGARVVRQFPPRGYGPAMDRLLYEATTDVVVTMDCDGTYPANRILDLLRLVEDGADLVNATRTRRRPKAMPLPNYVANRVFAATARALHGLRTTDVHSGMRAYRTSMLRGFSVDPKGPALPVDLMVVPARLGYRIVEVEIPYFERVGTTSLQRFDSTVWTFRRMARAMRSGSRARGERWQTR